MAKKLSCWPNRSPRGMGAPSIVTCPDGPVDGDLVHGRTRTGEGRRTRSVRTPGLQGPLLPQCRLPTAARSETCQRMVTTGRRESFQERVLRAELATFLPV